MTGIQYVSQLGVMWQNYALLQQMLTLFIARKGAVKEISLLKLTSKIIFLAIYFLEMTSSDMFIVPSGNYFVSSWTHCICPLILIMLLGTDQRLRYNTAFYAPITCWLGLINLSSPISKY